MFPRKYRIHAILILSVLAIIIVPQITNKPDKNKTAAANSSAQEFLQMVDTGKYSDSWVVAAAYLKETLPQNDWIAKLTKIRKTLGTVSARTLEDAEFTAPAEEMPEREMIQLEYSTQFKQRELREVVTVSLEDDNRWRVIGYFIQ